MSHTPTARKIAPEVMAVLEQADATAAGIVLTGQLDRKLYERVNAVLIATGFKWNRQAKAHTHPDASPAEALDSLLSTGEVIRPGDFGFFETPEPVAERVMDLAGDISGLATLDPSCGTGNLIAAAEKRGASVFGYELLQANIDALYKRGLHPEGGVTCCDFLTVPRNAVFDRVLMNPPFARQADIDHVSHAVGFLRPGGRLVSIMSAGVRFRQNAKTLAFLDMIAGFEPHWEDLPPGSFKVSGTSVNTCILTLSRPNV